MIPGEFYTMALSPENGLFGIVQVQYSSNCRSGFWLRHALPPVLFWRLGLWNNEFDSMIQPPPVPRESETRRRQSHDRFGDLVKAVVDLERRIMMIDAELHADQEAELLAGGSRQQDLWGINFYPELPESDWLEFDSMINLRPSFGNRSRGVDDPATRQKVAALARELVRR